MDYPLPCVYILTNKPRGVLYTGVTSNPGLRIWQHRQKFVDGFCRRYNTDRLVWFEIHADMYAAITREKRIKRWNRSWKIELVESTNPEWKDLSDEIFR